MSEVQSCMPKERPGKIGVATHAGQAVVQGAPQRGEVSRLDALRQEIAHVAFAFAQLSVDEQRLDAARAQPIRERHGLNRRAADVQARDDSDDAHRWDCTT